jgi:hypothetical protein
MPTGFCNKCGQTKDLVTVRTALMVTEVSRSTLYYWMKKDWIHWLRIPSGRRVICRDSLFRISGPTEILNSKDGINAMLTKAS